jgi:hypothetical protein
MLTLLNNPSAAGLTQTEGPGRLHDLDLKLHGMDMESSTVSGPSADHEAKEIEDPPQGSTKG